MTNDPSKFCPEAKVIHIDVDPANISKLVLQCPSSGRPFPVLTELLEALEDRLKEAPELVDEEARLAWWSRIEGWRTHHDFDHDQRHRNEAEATIKPQTVVQALLRATGGDAYVTSDVGQHQMFAAQYYRFDAPRRWVNSGGAWHHGLRVAGGQRGVKLAFRMRWWPALPVRAAFR